MLSNVRESGRRTSRSLGKDIGQDGVARQQGIGTDAEVQRGYRHGRERLVSADAPSEKRRRILAEPSRNGCSLNIFPQSQWRHLHRQKGTCR